MLGEIVEFVLWDGELGDAGRDSSWECMEAGAGSRMMRDSAVVSAMVYRINNARKKINPVAYFLLLSE